MDINSAFPSKYLKASDCETNDLNLTINDVSIEEVGQEKERKPVAFFTEREQGLVLNKTNSNIIAGAFGSQTENWIGKQIELYSAKTFMGSREVDCLRVRIPTNTPTDSIPF